MQLFPHEVADVQPVLDLLSRQDPTDSEVRLAVPELHLCTLASCVFFAYIVFVVKHLLYHLLISDLGNSLHAVVMAVHDLPYTF